MDKDVTRARRTILAVPGSSDRFIAKSRTQPVDAIFLDLEDAVAPPVKEASRQRVVEALNDPQGWQAPTVTYRVNDWSTPWTTMDIVEVVGGAGAKVDCIVLPKVTDADQVKALDLVLTQAEQAAGLPVGGIGLELQIEEARGLLHVAEIAAASARTETLVYGPGDWMANMGMKTLNVGSQPPGYVGDAFHHVQMSILVAARAHGLQAIDGPFVGIRDLEGFKTSASSSAALGYDGKWVLHPSQVEAGNDIFTPPAENVERARRIVEAYRDATAEAGGAVGAIVVDDEMVDGAGLAVARATLAKIGERA
ncbi:MAG: CoA ester lyase [Luteococcus sp.]|uniref:HpcH/HpaI aldolase/citrate lyase family protein n=1 Tax=Luteococcus sp. TaxID=1969402 RepID=UPI002648D700|nr:CoA ester lyase [Luteococcus sp.]MDN5564783.1 CoA ester lyase [Luteococcus sp.]